MNKLKTNILTRHQWGTEIVWSLTNSYMTKTIEIAPNKSTPLMTHGEKELSLIVIKGPLHLICGPFDNPQNLKAYELPDGWSWHIDAGTSYRYEAKDTPITIIEVSTPQLNDIVSAELNKENKTIKKTRKSKKDGTSR